MSAKGKKPVQSDDDEDETTIVFKSTDLGAFQAVFALACRSYEAM